MPGHTTISMTVRYAHMITSHLQRAMSIFDAKPGTKTGTTRAYSGYAEVEPALTAEAARPKIFVGPIFCGGEAGIIRSARITS
jgi:hypothetical protein